MMKRLHENSPAGKGKVVIQVIAGEAGVSTATVSRVINNQPLVSDSTRRRVLEIAAAHGYRPRVIPNKRNVVGLVVDTIPHIARSFYMAELVSAISQALVAKNFIPAILNVESLDKFPTLCHGAIVLSYENVFEELSAMKRKYPLVVVNDDYGKGFYSVSSDHYQGIKKALSYLADRGHRLIGYIGRDNGSLGAGQRFKAYEDFVSENLNFQVNYLGIFSEEPVLYEAVAKIIQRRATALILGGQALTMEAMRVLYLLNKKIPEDISLVGFESKGMSEYLCPSLTTVKQPIDEIGRIAGELIVDILQGKKVRTKVKLKNELIERDSVRILSNV